MSPTSLLSRTFLAGLLTVGLLAAGLRADEAKRDYQPSESLGDVLSTTFKAEMEAKNYDGAISILDAELAKVSDKTSYDAAILYLTKSQTLLQKTDYANSIIPLEKGVQLSDSHTPTYFEDRVVLESVYYLAILYYQEAATSKNPEVVTADYDKAEIYINRWVNNTKKVTNEGLSFYASLLYNRSLQDPEHPDKARLEKALAVVERALHMAVHPKDNLYVLKLACLQQLNRNSEVTELLELLVREKPDNKMYWAQLAALYLNQSQDIRAVLAIERAQSFGHMNTSKDIMNLFGIHFNIAQYGRAAEILEKSLHEGTVENEEKNWELLASCYQQLNRDLKAIDILIEATKFFPKDGQLEFLIAQNYYNLEKYPESLQHLQLSVAKGGGHKPHSTYLFMAFIAFEMKQFDVALDAANHAMAYPEAVKEATRMKQAIEETLKDREQKLKQ